MKRAGHVAALAIAATLLIASPATAAVGHPTPTPHHRHRPFAFCAQPYRANACIPLRPVIRYLYGGAR